MSILTTSIPKGSQSPPGWQYFPLGEIADITMGNSPPGDSYNEGGNGVPLINGPVEFSEGAFGRTVKSKYTTAPTKMCKEGDFLICVRGSTTGRTNIAAYDACIGRGVAAIRSRMNQRYVNHFVRTLERRIHASGKGSTFPSISQQQLHDLAVPLPYPEDKARSIREQNRIADILDKADAIRHKRLEVTDVFGTLGASAFLAFFGDPITNPYGWKMETLETVVNTDGRGLKRGPFGGSLKKEIFVEKGYKVYEQKHAIADDFTLGGYFVDEEKFQEMEAFAVRPGDLIVSCSGTMGRIAIVPESAQPGIINQALLRITPDKTKISALYLKMLLETIPVQRHFYGFSRGSGLKNFPPMKEVRALPVPVPSRKRLDEFHRYLERSHDAGENVRLLSDEANNLFNSLVQRAFRGDL